MAHHQSKVAKCQWQSAKGKSRAAGGNVTDPNCDVGAAACGGGFDHGSWSIDIGFGCDEVNWKDFGCVNGKVGKWT
jgi:hypothetical protein